MPLAKPYPDASFFRERLDYDPETGFFYWKPRERHHFATQRAYAIFHKRDVGKVAGSTTKSGYIYLGIRPRKFLAHRVAMLMSGYDLEGWIVDHVNGDPSDNRLCNLRLADYSINGRNGAMRSTNTSGVTGVVWSKQASKWKARFYVKPYEVETIGLFDNLDDARDALSRVRLRYGYTERHGL